MPHTGCRRFGSNPVKLRKRAPAWPELPRQILMQREPTSGVTVEYTQSFLFPPSSLAINLLKMFPYCGQPPLQVPLHKLNWRAHVSRQAPVVQRLSQFANMFSQFWQQVGIIAVAEACV